ncbi:MAG: glutathione S-transferase family protein [Pseudomonadota bacterium]
MPYTLYFSPDSANIVVRMTLEEMGLAYQDREVPRKRVDRDDAFMRLNPRGLLPVLIDDDDDFALFETGAILLYLADKHGQLAPPVTEPRARGAALKWLFMLSNTLHADLAMRFYPERYVIGEAEVDPLLLATRKRVHGHLQMIDDVIGAHDGDWFLESGLSVCDFYLGCCVRWAQIYPVGDEAIDGSDVKAMTNLTTFLSKLQERPSVQRALAREGITGNAFIDAKARLPARERDKIDAAMP